MHFCCQELVDVAIFGKAKVCQDKSQKQDIFINQNNSFQEKDCCSGQLIVKIVNDNVEKTINDKQEEFKIFLNSFLFSNANPFGYPEKNTILFEQYRPPLISKDIQVLYETFLI